MRNINKILVAVIAIILVFSVVGCGPAKSNVVTIQYPHPGSSRHETRGDRSNRTRF